LQLAKTFLNALRNPIYYSFLFFILEIINKITFLFQNKRPLITQLLTSIEKYYKLKCYFKNDYINNNSLIDPANVREYLEINLERNKMYFGAKLKYCIQLQVHFILLKLKL